MEDARAPHEVGGDLGRRVVHVGAVLPVEQEIAVALRIQRDDGDPGEVLARDDDGVHRRRPRPRSCW